MFLTDYNYRCLQQVPACIYGLGQQQLEWLKEEGAIDASLRERGKLRS